MGERDTGAGARRLRRLGPHRPRPGGSRRPGRARARGAAGRGRGGVPTANARGGARRAALGGGAGRAEPGQRGRAAPDEGYAARLEEFFSTEEPTVALRRQAHPAEGRRPAARCATRRSACAESSSASVRSARSWSSWRRSARSSPARSSIATSPTLLPLADVMVVPSVFPEAFGMVAAEGGRGRHAAARRAPLGSRGGRRRPRGGIPGRASATWRRSPACRPGSLDARLRELLELPAVDRAALGAAARRAAVERWSWASVGRRLLGPLQGLH